jgi:hypothetical protein
MSQHYHLPRHPEGWGSGRFPTLWDPDGKQSSQQRIDKCIDGYEEEHR